MNIAIIGASGAIGSAFVDYYASRNKGGVVYALSRTEKTFNYDCVNTGHLDFDDEDSIAAAAQTASQSGALDCVIIATGILHHGDVMPEKSLRAINPREFEHIFHVNTIGPMMAVKHFSPLLHTEKRSILAALSARVGSISDNNLGGWYSYRASKAALNMLLKTTSIEIARKNKNAIIAGIHPGTVASDLSAPFQKTVADGKLFTPEYSVSQMIGVLDDLTPKESGRIWGWDKKEILP